MYRTEIGEPADETPILPAALLNICRTLGDSRASLKFLVKQTDVPPSSAASVIPPVSQTDYHPFRAAADPRRAGIPPITTDLSNPVLYRVSSRHSKEGSVSSASGEMLNRGELSASDWSDLGHEAEDWSAPGLSRSTRKSVLQNAGVRLSTSTGGSRSPVTEHSASLGTSSPALPTPPIPPHSTSLQAGEPSIRSSPSSRSSSRHYEFNELSLPPQFDHFKPSNATSVFPRSGTPINDSYQNENAFSGPSHPAMSQEQGSQGLGLTLDDDIDPETRALIEQFQREEQEAQKKEEERRRQLEADEELAKREQQSERELWEMMQQMQKEQRQREQAQIAEDEARAVSSIYICFDSVLKTNVEAGRGGAETRRRAKASTRSSPYGMGGGATGTKGTTRAARAARATGKSISYI